MMESNITTTIRGALTQHELEEILDSATQGLKVSCLSFVRYSIVVFAMSPPDFEARVVETIALGDNYVCARRCTAAAKKAAIALQKVTGSFVRSDRTTRTIDIARDSLARVVQTQIAFRFPALGSCFAILLPDIAWSRHFPAIAGPLVAVVATKLSLPEDKPRTLRVLCCRNHVAEHALEDEKKWRAAASAAMNGGMAAAHLGINVDVDERGFPHALGVLNTPFTRVIGWDAFPVALSEIHGSHWDEFVGKYHVEKEEVDLEEADDE